MIKYDWCIHLFAKGSSRTRTNRSAVRYLNHSNTRCIDNSNKNDNIKNDNNNNKNDNKIKNDNNNNKNTKVNLAPVVFLQQLLGMYTSERLASSDIRVAEARNPLTPQAPPHYMIWKALEGPLIGLFLCSEEWHFLTNDENFSSLWVHIINNREIDFWLLLSYQ